MVNKFNIRGLASIFVFASIVAGCGIAPSASPSSNYYILSPLDQAKDVKGQAHDVSVGIGPVNIPPHLDRSQIVGRPSAHKLDLSSLDQWAEPLKDNFTRVLAENLSLLLASDNVETYPWHRSIDVDYQVVVDVIRFDANQNRENILIARWKVFADNGRKFLFSRRSKFNKKIPLESFESTVETMSANLARLSREIAAEIIRKLGSGPVN